MHTYPKCKQPMEATNIHSGSHVMRRTKIRQSAIRTGSRFGRMHVPDADTSNCIEPEEAD